MSQSLVSGTPNSNGKDETPGQSIDDATIPRILRPKSTYTIDYPQAVEFAESQMNIYWLPTEIKVEKDVQDLMVNMTPAEKHGVITTLKLFTLYELRVGGDYWLGRIRNTFRRPEIEFMASTFGFVELGIHARFYNQINEAMMLNTDEFYASYLDDPTLKSRIEFVEAAASDEDLPFALGVFSLIEGAVLYSNFAFLKHFQSQGKNKLVNVNAGINFSVKDESLHALAGAWLYRTLVGELKLDAVDVSLVEMKIVEAAKAVYEHEARIVDMIFEHGDMDGIDSADMKKFVQHRINLCLENLGIAPIYEDTESHIETWFYLGTGGIATLGDFFYAVNSEYNRNWNEQGFVW